MTSLILRTSAQVLEPLLLFYACYVLVAGHDEPGGGFVGGLVVAAAFTLHAIAFGVASARRALRADPRSLMGAGLLLALASVWAGVLAGSPPMTGLWLGKEAVSVLALGTPVLFDLGVFLVVAGTALAIVFSLSEERR